MSKSYYKDSCLYVNGLFSPLFKSVDLEWGENLEEALEFTKMGLKPREVVLFSWVTGIALFFFTFPAALAGFFIGINPIYILLGGLFISCFGLYLVSVYPMKKMAMERMKALGYAPHIIAYLVIPLKQDPNLEKAVKFAAENGDDKLTDDLKKLLWLTWSGKYTSVGEALPMLGVLWGDQIKGLRDALYNVRASQVEKNEARRLSSLDRAMTDLLSNMETKFREFMENLRMPTMLVFMTGVLIPMTAILFLPVLSMMGLELGKPKWIILILLGITFVVLLISEFILSKRPAAFAPIDVPDTYPGLTSPGMMRVMGQEVSIRKVSFGIFFFFALWSFPYIMGYQHDFFRQLNLLPLVAGLFMGVWAYLYFDGIEKYRIRNIIEQAEEDCIEACFHIGNRLMSGMPAEEALIRVSDMLSESGNDSLLSSVLERTVRNIRYTHLDLSGAFFDKDHGSLRDVCSGLIHGLFKLFSSSMERGVDAAAETLIHSARHFRDIRKVEEALRTQVAYTTSMMRASVVYIAPALCGLTIPLMETFINLLREISLKNSGMEEISNIEIGFIKVPEVSPEALTLILGVYIFILLVMLTRFSVILESGNDRIKIRVEIGKALPKALAVYVAVIFLGRYFFDMMISDQLIA